MVCGDARLALMLGAGSVAALTHEAGSESVAGLSGVVVENFVEFGG
jgi:hypothetical protein